MLCDQEANLFMHIGNGATSVSMSLVWPQLKVFEVIDNETFDYLCKHGYLKEREFKFAFDVETKKRKAELFSCYTDPKNVECVTQLVGGTERTYYPFHYPATNMSIENTGSFDKSLFVCKDRITDIKKKWYEYEMMDAIIVTQVLYYAMSCLQVKDNEDDFNGASDAIILMGPMMTLCKSAIMHFALYYRYHDRCDIYTGDAKSFKEKFRCRYDIEIDAMLCSKATAALDFFCKQRKYYFDPSDGFARSIHNRVGRKVDHTVAEEQRAYNAITHDETTKWELRLGAKNSPLALQHLSQPGSANRRVSPRNHELSSSVSVASTSTVVASPQLAITESLLKLEKSTVQKLKNELAEKEAAILDLQKKVKQLPNIKKLEAINVSSDKTIESLQKDNEMLNKKLENLKKQASSKKPPVYVVSNSSQSCSSEVSKSSSIPTPVSVQAVTCPVEAEVQMAAKRKRVAEIELETQILRLRAERNQARIDRLARVDYQREMFLKRQQLQQEMSDDIRRKEIEDNYRERQAKRMDDDHDAIKDARKQQLRIQLLEATTHAQMDLAKLTHDSSLMHTIVNCNSRNQQLHIQSHTHTQQTSTEHQLQRIEYNQQERIENIPQKLAICSAPDNYRSGGSNIDRLRSSNTSSNYNNRSNDSTLADTNGELHDDCSMSRAEDVMNDDERIRLEQEAKELRDEISRYDSLE